LFVFYRTGDVLSGDGSQMDRIGWGWKKNYWGWEENEAAYY